MEISFCSLPETFDFPEKWQSFLKEVLQAAGKMEEVAADREVEFVLTNDMEIHKLNREYRSKDVPTDVLSFAWEESEDLFPGEDQMLGQIIISLDRAKEQAEEYGHSLEREMAFLSIHGLLHLLGYDHEIGPAEEKQMREREKEILDSLGIDREGESKDES